LSEFFERLNLESHEIKKQVKLEINNPILKVKLFLRDKLPSMLEVGKKIVKREEFKKSTVVSGKDRGFTNVLQAAQFIANEIL
jgi:hypothetical protein